MLGLTLASGHEQRAGGRRWAIGWVKWSRSGKQPCQHTVHEDQHIKASAPMPGLLLRACATG